MLTQYPSARRRARFRRGLPAVLWGLACFVVFQGAYYVLAHWLPEFHDPEYGGKLVRLRACLAEQPRAKPFVLVLGSSHVGMGVRPDVLATGRPNPHDGPLVFNFAINAGTPMVSLVCLRRLLAEGIHPDWVLVETCGLQLAADGPGAEYNNCLPLIFVQRQDLALLNRYYARPDRLWRDWLLTESLPWFYHRHYLLSLVARHWLARDERLGIRWQHVDDRGWQWVPGHTEGYATNLRRLEATRVACATMYEHFSISDVTRRTLLEIVDTCRRQHIGVAFLRMPEARVFQDWCPPAIAGQADAFLGSLSREQQVPLIDARNWVGEEGFSDGHHLTPLGAGVFMRRFEQEVIGPLFGCGL
jgi:hypothetical protein